MSQSSFAALDRTVSVKVCSTDSVSVNTDTAIVRIEARVSVFRLASPESIAATLASIGEQLAAGHNIAVADIS